MDLKELNEILENHKRWSDGDTGKRADLRNADLRNADLGNANLCYANLCNADLRGADLRGANLRNADLRGANLRNADLGNANLCYANLCYANLRNADLRGANLRYADLGNANLRGANLRNADLRGANLRNAKIDQHELVRRQIVTSEGAFTAFKKLSEGCICELEVSASAKRVGGLTERKCRVSEAKVVRITDRGGADMSEQVSTHDCNFKYIVGETVTVDNFCDDPREVCAPGIHCYITKLEAEEHSF